MTYNLSFKHLIESAQITHDDCMFLIEKALKLKKDSSGNIIEVDRKTILASLFFEASTRTRFSFESAMLKLGGQFINLEHGNSSSTAKGESLEDMGQVMSGYADIMVIRHPKKGSVKEFVKHVTVPTINAGDGANEHPTQSLIDVMTIFENHQRLDNLSIGFWGDLKYARTINSMIQLMSRLKQKKFTFIALPEFQLSNELIERLKTNGHQVEITTDLHSVLPSLDVLYLTRTQKERFEDNRLIESLPIITADLLNNISKGCSILHPLPRVQECDVSVDRLPNAKYFEQAHNGLYMRMALIHSLLNN